MIVSAASTCWECGAARGDGLECTACGRLQPLSGDYFTLFGLPRRLVVDESALRDKFYALSRQLHPDRFAAAPEHEREISTRNTAWLNQGYRTLRDPLLRAAYVAGTADKKPDPAFLMELLEVQERIEEWRGGDAAARTDLEEALEDFRGRVRSLDEGLQRDFRAWDALGDTPAEEERAAVLSHIRDNLGSRKYIRNVIRDITDALGA